MKYTKISDDRNVLPSRIVRSTNQYNFPESRTVCEVSQILTSAKYDEYSSNGLWTARQVYYQLIIYDLSSGSGRVVYTRLHSSRQHVLIDMQDYLIRHNLFNPDYKTVEVFEPFLDLGALNVEPSSV